MRNDDQDKVPQSAVTDEAVLAALSPATRQLIESDLLAIRDLVADYRSLYDQAKLGVDVTRSYHEAEKRFNARSPKERLSGDGGFPWDERISEDIKRAVGEGKLQGNEYELFSRAREALEKRREEHKAELTKTLGATEMEADMWVKITASPPPTFSG